METADAETLPTIMPASCPVPMEFVHVIVAELATAFRLVVLVQVCNLSSFVLLIKLLMGKRYWH